MKLELEGATGGLYAWRVSVRAPGLGGVGCALNVFAVAPTILNRIRLTELEYRQRWIMTTQR